MKWWLQGSVNSFDALGFLYLHTSMLCLVYGIQQLDGETKCMVDQLKSLCICFTIAAGEQAKPGLREHGQAAQLYQSLE